MAGLNNERFYPATPDETYAALVSAARRIGKVKSADAFSRAVSFATEASGFSWGATMSAFVVPEGEGSIVRVGGTAKVRVNLTAKNAEFKNTIKVLDGVAQAIQAQRSGMIDDYRRPFIKPGVLWALAAMAGIFCVAVIAMLIWAQSL